MIVQLPKEVSKVIKDLENHGFEAYVVGGAVRDLLMKKIVYDWDLTTNAKPEEILNIFKNAFYDNSFGTVGIPSETENERPIEITTFRTEHGYSDTRRPDKVEWGENLNEDLKRRDFTINAMALRLKVTKQSKKSLPYVDCTMDLIDLFDGKNDLENKLIRAVGDPNERFSEDALRMIRAVRIASEIGFNIEENTLQAISSNVSLINKIAKERIRDELFKILKSPFSYEGILIFRNVGLLQEVLPELEKTFGVEQKSPGRHHIYDVGTHSLLTMKYCPSANPITKFAALIHDIGKPQTYKKLENGTITFYNHETAGSKIAERISDRLKLSNKDRDKLVRLVRWHLFSVNEFQTDQALRRFIRNVTKDYLQDILDIRIGDRLGSGSKLTSWRLEEFKRRLIEVQNQPFSISDLKINGNDIMKICKLTPGPKVGEILQKLFDEVVEKKIPNRKTDLLEHLSDFTS